MSTPYVMPCGCSNCAGGDPCTVAPVFTSANSWSLSCGYGGTFNVTATGSPMYSATGLPSFASINSTTGVITISSSTNSCQVYSCTLSATNACGTTNQAFTILIVSVGFSGGFSDTGGSVAYDTIFCMVNGIPPYSCNCCASGYFYVKFKALVNDFTFDVWLDGSHVISSGCITAGNCYVNNVSFYYPSQFKNCEVKIDKCGASYGTWAFQISTTPYTCP